MVLCKRRKTCLVAGPAFPAIPEDSQLESRRDSVESSGSSAAWPASSSRCSMAPAISFHRAKRSFGCGLATDCDCRTVWRPAGLEGVFTLVCQRNYDKFLAALGAGPLSSNMVLRARTNLSIKQVHNPVNTS